MTSFVFLLHKFFWFMMGLVDNVFMFAAIGALHYLVVGVCVGTVFSIAGILFLLKYRRNTVKWDREGKYFVFSCFMLGLGLWPLVFPFVPVVVSLAMVAVVVVATIKIYEFFVKSIDGISRSRRGEGE